MSLAADSDQVARRAYALWEEEGRPHGRDKIHWEQAAREATAAPEEIHAEVEPADVLAADVTEAAMTEAAAEVAAVKKPRRTAAKPASPDAPKPARKRKASPAA